jgi:hypothetical protein
MMDLVKLSYEASPLRLYRRNSLVESGDVNDTLTGAVVQVFFVIRHCYLRDKKIDTFRTDIQQIKILKPGSSIACSGFKRRSARAKDRLTLSSRVQVLRMRKLTNLDGLRKDQSK